MKSPQDWNKQYQALGSTRDMVEWIAQIQCDARESILLELNTTRTELGWADEVICKLQRKLEDEPSTMNPPHKTIRLSRTPRTDKTVSANSDPSAEEYADLSSFCRVLEIERNSLEYQLSYANSRIEALKKFAEQR